jgi:hypothetical protein
MPTIAVAKSTDLGKIICRWITDRLPKLGEVVVVPLDSGNSLVGQVLAIIEPGQYQGWAQNDTDHYMAVKEQK